MNSTYNVANPILVRTFKDQFDAWDFFHREIVNNKLYLWAKLVGCYIFVVHM